MRTLKKILLAATAVAALLTAVVAYQVHAWKRGLLDRFEAGSQLVKTPRGAIEHVVRGEGSPVLVLHGSPGGYDQALMFVDAAGEFPHRIIAPSRPGYGRTGLGVGKTLEEHAEALRDLLDVLAVPRVAIVAVSGGGPLGLQFAARYPERCTSLSLISAVSEQVTAAELKQEQSDIELTGSNVSIWAIAKLAQWAPGMLLSELIPDAKTLERVNSDPKTLAQVLGLIEGFGPSELRVIGYRNDIELLSRPLGIPLQQLRVPTLLVHGRNDRNVSVQHAEAVARVIPGAKLVILEDADHICFFTHAARVWGEVRDFIRTNEAGTLNAGR
jgi:pimeloyl-ACP methyl ester carboxylesterase